MLGRNQVLYLDAFDSVKAAVRYTTTRSSFEADVILQERLPDPQELGLRPEAVRLEVWTEFLAPPVPQVAATQRQRKDGQTENDVVLDFGAMRIGLGNAFTLPQEGAIALESERDQYPRSGRLLMGRPF